MATEPTLEQRVIELERRLARYHEVLEDALEHDRQFQLGATWGFINSLVGAGTFLAVLWGAEKLGFDGWLLGTLAAVAALAGWAGASAWSDRGRLADLKKLSQLPKWEPRDYR